MKVFRKDQNYVVRKSNIYFHSADSYLITPRPSDARTIFFKKMATPMISMLTSSMLTGCKLSTSEVDLFTLQLESQPVSVEFKKFTVPH